jgi:hypothetical protein
MPVLRPRLPDALASDHRHPGRLPRRGTCAPFSLLSGAALKIGGVVIRAAQATVSSEPPGGGPLSAVVVPEKSKLGRFDMTELILLARCMGFGHAADGGRGGLDAAQGSRAENQAQQPATRDGPC